MRDDDIRHIHPVHYKHINPLGHYRFDTRRGPAKGRLRPLRLRHLHVARNTSD